MLVNRISVLLFAFANICGVCIGSQYELMDYGFFPAVHGWLRLSTEPSDWPTARINCHMQGAFLLSPWSDEFISAVDDLRKYRGLENSEFIYSGIHSSFAEGALVYTDGKPRISLNPQDMAALEQCGVFFSTGTTGLVPCGLQLPYICYAPETDLLIPMSLTTSVPAMTVTTSVPDMSSTSTVPAMSLSSETKCGEPSLGYQIKNTMCIKSHVLSEDSIHNANIVCQSEGAQFAVSRNDRELSFYIGLMLLDYKIINRSSFTAFYDTNFEETAATTKETQQLSQTIYMHRPDGTVWFVCQKKPVNKFPSTTTTNPEFEIEPSTETLETTTEIATETTVSDFTTESSAEGSGEGVTETIGEISMENIETTVSDFATESSAEGSGEGVTETIGEILMENIETTVSDFATDSLDEGSGEGVGEISMENIETTVSDFATDSLDEGSGEGVGEISTENIVESTTGAEPDMLFENSCGNKDGYKYIKLTGNCYKFHIQALDLFEMNSQCKDEGANLAHANGDEIIVYEVIGILPIEILVEYSADIERLIDSVVVQSQMPYYDLLGLDSSDAFFKPLVFKHSYEDVKAKLFFCEKPSELIRNYINDPRSFTRV